MIRGSAHQKDIILNEYVPNHTFKIYKAKTTRRRKTNYCTDTAGDFNIPLPGTELVYSQQGYGRTEQHQQPTRLNCNQEYAIQRRIHAFQVHTGRQPPR